MQPNDEMMEFWGAAMKSTADMTSAMVAHAERMSALQARAVREACSWTTEVWNVEAATPLEYFARCQARALELIVRMARDPD